MRARYLQRLLFSIAVIQSTRKTASRQSAFGQKRTIKRTVMKMSLTDPIVANNQRQIARLLQELKAPQLAAPVVIPAVARVVRRVRRAEYRAAALPAASRSDCQVGLPARH